MLCYDIQAWLYDNTGEDEVLGFALWLEPLYVSDPQQEALLTLNLKPDAYLDYSSPSIEFQSERKALCKVDFEESTFTITLQFRILVDLEKHQWQFLD